MALKCPNCRSLNFFITELKKATCRDCGTVEAFEYNQVPGMPELKGLLLEALHYNAEALNDLAERFNWHKEKSAASKHACFFNMWQWLKYGEVYTTGAVFVLTLQQPYASLLAAGRKLIDTRAEATAYRGLVLIHAASYLPADLPALLQQPAFEGLTVEDLPTGQLLGIATLTSCIKVIAPELKAYAEEVKQGQLFYGLAEGPEASYSDFTPNRYAYHYAEFKALKTPVNYHNAIDGFSPYVGNFSEIIKQVG